MTADRYYVQVSRSHGPYGRAGWQTENVFLDRASAEAMAESHERASYWAEGEDQSEKTVTIARVITAAELLEQEGPDALAAAEAATRRQLGLRLQEEGES